MNRTAESVKKNPTKSSLLLATRPWSFSASCIPVILGNVLAWKEDDSEFSIFLCILSIICVVAIHTGGNLTNTYYDFVNGVDNYFSDDKTLVDRELEPDAVFNMSIVSYIMGITSFIIILTLSVASGKLLLFLFIIGISGAFFYTGSIALKYNALGDIVVILLFGPLAVISPYVVQTGRVSMSAAVFSIPLALHTEAILHANNHRDRIEDGKSNIKTLALLLDKEHSYLFYVCLLFAPYVFCIVMCSVQTWCFALNVLTLKCALNLEKDFRSEILKELPQKTAQLNLMFGIIYTSVFLL